MSSSTFAILLIVTSGAIGGFIFKTLLKELGIDFKLPMPKLAIKLPSFSSSSFSADKGSTIPQIWSGSCLFDHSIILNNFFEGFASGVWSPQKFFIGSEVNIDSRFANQGRRPKARLAKALGFRPSWEQKAAQAKNKAWSRSMQRSIWLQAWSSNIRRTESKHTIHPPCLLDRRNNKFHAKVFSHPLEIRAYSTCHHWWQVSHNKEGNQQSKRLIYSRSPVQQAKFGNWHSAVLMRAWLLRFKNTKLFWYRYRTRLYLSAPSNLKNINSLKWSKPSQEAGQDMLSKPEQSSSFSFGATFSTFKPIWRRFIAASGRLSAEP